MNTYGVIMAGGGGTRFWPLSRQKEPKQLLNLSGRALMINETIDRLSTVCPREQIFIVTNRDQADQMRDATAGRILPSQILAEPAARNTAACIGYAAAAILKKYGDGVLCITPADHFIKDEASYTRALTAAADTAAKEDCLLTLGITPTFPATGYGYIRYDKTEDALAKTVLSFREKPDLSTAEAYLKSGEYLWNAGMFAWKAGVILSQYETHLPKLYEGLLKIRAALGTPDAERVLEDIYPSLPAISVDYGVLEKSDAVKVIPADFGWHDIGAWDQLGVLYPADKNGNVHAGPALDINSTGLITYSKKRLIAGVGVQDLIIVETEDAILVCDKRRAQDVKKVTEALQEQGMIQYL